MTVRTIEIIDPSTGATAKIAPELGFNCYSFRPVVAGEPVETLWAAADFESGAARASGSGIPILFPFPGRLRGGVFRFGGRDYPLGYRDARGNAIHGLVLEGPWAIVERSQSRVAGRFQLSKQAAAEMWPADFCLTLTYELLGNTLRSDLWIQNPDDRPLPWGLGTHPYFRVPLARAGAADKCIVTVPNDSYFELIDMLPSGREFSADAARLLAKGKPFAATKLDDVLTGLATADGRWEASIVDPLAGRKLTLRCDEIFPHCVVYNPAHRQAICIEPYSCVPGLSVEPGSQPGLGLRLLPPGGEVRTIVEIELR
ncbi:MAG: aldose 1-epimerase [Planctomycetia bacterium]|nr:aldose 1-epimerase [Planctomycetia bacterium]